MSKALQVQKSLGTDLRKRQQGRLELRPSDGLQAYIRLSSMVKVPVCVFDVSIKGLCVLVPSTESLDLNIGSVIELEILSYDSKSYAVSGKVCWKNGFREKGTKYGIEIVREPFRKHRSEQVLTLPEYLPLVGAIYKPYLFYERAAFRVVDISPNFWTIKIFDSEILAFEGVELELYFSNTVGIEKSLKVRILNVIQPDGIDSVTLYVHVEKVPKKLQEWIGQQLIFNCNISPELVRQLGFSVKSVSNGFKFRFVKTSQEYEDVLKLRFDAYREAGKVGDDKTFKDMIAPLDHLSRIIAVYHGEKIVGSVAVTFPNRDDLTLDTERAFKNGYPKKIPPKTTLIEIARLCTHKDYRKTDLLNRIFEYTYKTLNCGDRDFILTSTDEKLWPLYRKLGFKKTGMSYPHPYLSGIEHFIILGTRATPDHAFGISPLVWNYLWRDMNAFLEAKGRLRKGLLQRVLLGFNRKLGKVLKINLKKRY